MVANILRQLAGGYDVGRIKWGYPELTDEDIKAAVEYAVALIEDEEIRLIEAR